MRAPELLWTERKLQFLILVLSSTTVDCHSWRIANGIAYEPFRTGSILLDS